MSKKRKETNVTRKPDAVTLKAQTDCRLALEALFAPLCSIYKEANYLRSLRANDYVAIQELGLKFKEICNETITDARSIAQFFSDLYQSDIDGLEGEDLSIWTEMMLEQIKTEVLASIPHKESLDLFKMSAKSIVLEDGKIPAINTNAFYDAKSEKPKVGGIPILKTSEGGINRLFRKEGVKAISVDFKSFGSDPENVEARNAKARILWHGLFDTFNGDLYLPAFQSVSGSRQAIVMFCAFPGLTYTDRAEIIDRIKNLWVKLNGFGNWESYKGALSNKDGLCNMAKTIARTGTQGSSSHHICDKNPEFYDTHIRNANVRYVADTETFVCKNVKTFNDEGEMHFEENKSVKIKDCDGEGIASVSMGAAITHLIGGINGQEFAFFEKEWAAVGKDLLKVEVGSKLDKILNKIFWDFQIRHGEKKGTIVIANIEAIEELKGIDIIIPDSVRKFIGAEWSEYDLDICGWLKPNPKKFVKMNQQFINALKYENPNALLPILEYWKNYLAESIDNPAKAMEFHHILGSAEDADGSNDTLSDNAHLLRDVIASNSALMDDNYIVAKRKEQYEKFVEHMAIGKLLIPGQYTYMVFDPYYALNKWFGLNLPTLQSGEYYFCDKECYAGLFRSPLIASYEAKKVKLVSNPMYRYLQNCVIFNGFDGGADDMGGGDHDGDKCLVCTDDNDFGKVIIDGISDENYVVQSSAGTPKLVELTYENFLYHLLDRGTITDRTGIITNYGSGWKDMAEHLRAMLETAKSKGCETITFIHPQAYGKGLGCNVMPTVSVYNGVKTLNVRAFVKCVLAKGVKSALESGELSIEDLQPNQVWFVPDEDGVNGPQGEVSFERVQQLIAEYETRNDDIRNRQGAEIDSAKTGEIVVIPKKDQCPFVSRHALYRKGALDKSVSYTQQINSYLSYSPLSICYLYSISKVQPLIKDKFEASTSKAWELELSITDEEATLRNRVFTYEGVTGTLEDIIRDRKTKYNRAVARYSELGELDAIGILKREEYSALRKMAVDLNVPVEIVAACAYFVTYNKDEKQREGLSYAWILCGELLSVFSRRGKGLERICLPKNADSASVKDNVLYVNGKAFKKLTNRVADGDLLIHNVNDSIFALLKVESKQEVKRTIIASNALYGITVMGFKYHKAKDLEGWKQLMRENDYSFRIGMEENGRACCFIGDESICAIATDKNSSKNIELYGKTVRIVGSDIEWHEASAKIKVAIC